MKRLLKQYKEAILLPPAPYFNPIYSYITLHNPTLTLSIFFFVGRYVKRLLKQYKEATVTKEYKR